MHDVIGPSHTTAGRVRAIVVNYNRADLTLHCVQSLLGQLGTLQLEIVVVDNHSCEEDWRSLQRKLAEYSVTLHRSSRNLGYAGGINAGAKLETDHTSEYILVLNSDIALPSTETTRQLVGVLQEDPRRVACSPLISDHDCPVPPHAAIQVRRLPGFWMLLAAHSCWLSRTKFGHRLRSAYAYEDSRPFPPETTLDCETINGACFMITRQFLESIGYLDDRTFLYMEEHILGAIIRARNGTACLCTAAVADHIQGASTGMKGNRRPLRRELQQVSSELLYLRHYTRTNFFGQALFLLVRSIDLLLKALCSPTWKARLIAATNR